MSALDRSMVEHELAYWREVLKNKTHTIFDKEHLREGLRSLTGRSEGLWILDAGSGPRPYLCELAAENMIIAADPLAPYYTDIVVETGYHHSVPIVPLPCEALGRLFRPGTFDFVTCNNAIDHMQDPIRAFDVLVDLVRPGGAFQLTFAENEADRQGHSGFHQWNFTWDAARQEIGVAGEQVSRRLALGDHGLTLIRDKKHSNDYVNLYLRKSD